jgi:hypothetical protein
MLGADDTQHWMDWSCFTEMTFEDELHFQQFLAFIYSDASAPLIELEHTFVVAEKTKVVLQKRTISRRLE